YYQQHQYFPLLAFEGTSGFPLAAWLRPGRAGANWGVVETLDRIVQRLRAAWPDVLILVRGDNGGAGPDLYEYCEAEGLLYAFGYSSNAGDQGDGLRSPMQTNRLWIKSPLLSVFIHNPCVAKMLRNPSLCPYI